MNDSHLHEIVERTISNSTFYVEHMQQIFLDISNLYTTHISTAIIVTSHLQYMLLRKSSLDWNRRDNSLSESNNCQILKTHHNCYESWAYRMVLSISLQSPCVLYSVRTTWTSHLGLRDNSSTSYMLQAVWIKIKGLKRSRVIYEKFITLHVFPVVFPRNPFYLYPTWNEEWKTTIITDFIPKDKTTELIVSVPYLELITV